MFGQMDGRIQKWKVCWRLHLSEGFLKTSLLLIVIWMNVSMTSYGQQQPGAGFLSIYCGSPTPAVIASNSLEFVSDVNSSYIKTGISSAEVTNTSYEYFRLFPERRNKYCYELPTIANTTYLFRATFTDPVTSNLSLPIQFIVSIEATTVYTMRFDSIENTNVTGYGITSAREVIFFSPDDVTYVCLQPVVGTAFISTLELRPLDPDMYSYGGSHRQYLVTLQRWKVGANYSAPLIRFPEDSYDRSWSYTGDIGIPIVTAATAPDNSTSPQVNNIPPALMTEAWYGNMDVRFGELFPTAPVYVDPGQYVVCVAIYAEELFTPANGGTMSVSLDGFPGESLKVSDKVSMQFVPNFLLSANSISVFLSSTEQEQSFVSMNAVEIYAQYNFNLSATVPVDDAVITALKESFNLTDWQGDPCTPVPHDWLSCSTVSTGDTSNQNGGACKTTDAKCQAPKGEFLRAPYSVTSLNLSNLANSGFPVLQQNLAYSPENKLESLTQMMIRESGVDGSSFHFLINNFSGGELNVLDFSNNNIDSLPQGSDWGSLDKLVSLDLSHNNLSGTSLSSFDNAPFNDSLQELYLSNNAMTSLPTQWQNPVKNLTILDLSYNQFGGEISLLDQLIQMNTESLQELYVKNNGFTGTISPWYFSALPLLTVANFDHNSIQGTLNLTTWFAAVKEGFGNSTSNSTSSTQTLFSFVNNSISNIVPSVKDMESAIDSLRSSDPYFSSYGILLGGNPYCKAAKSEAQQYLCRSSVFDIIRKPKSSTTAILIAGICSGIFAFVIFCITLFIMWRLWKQVYALREIQQALADQKVQPPFYQYSDLKLATKDFHLDYKLGLGTYGEVYKAILTDQSKLAVKKLFNSQQLQVLTEFLNEVVLITGIKHRNLVQLKGCCIKDKQRILVYEYVEKGNLAQALYGSKAHGGLNWSQRFSICVGVARGLSYLHEELQPSIIHRDIKPENILLDKNFRPKIADFGLARQFHGESSVALYTKVAGTLGYFAPEYATQGQLSDKTDVYSYGIVVLETISGRKCIDYSFAPDVVFVKDWVQGMHKKGMVLDALQPELRDNCIEKEVIRAVNIGLLCVQHDPERRPSMSQVVTMLLGNVDVHVPLDINYDRRTSFKELLEVEYPSCDTKWITLPAVSEEELSESPLMDFGSESSGGSGSRTALIPMGNLVGRELMTIVVEEV